MKNHTAADWIKEIQKAETLNIHESMTLNALLRGYSEQDVVLLDNVPMEIVQARKASGFKKLIAEVAAR